jgi:hypothetical protein
MKCQSKSNTPHHDVDAIMKNEEEKKGKIKPVPMTPSSRLAQVTSS